jgi:hypothetical protein
MRPGGGKEKGSSFERVVCKDLSNWVTNNTRGDLFTRNVISGGSFTNAVAKGSKDHGMPGDIMANHPLAYTFLQLFMVECKHHKDINLDGYLYDNREASSLAKIINKTRKEAAHIGVRPLLVVKQNNRPAMLILERDAAVVALACVGHRLRLPWHSMHTGSIYLFEFQCFRRMVYASRFLAAVPPLTKA